MPQPSARIIEGKITQIRLAIPVNRKDVFLRIGADTVWGLDLDTSHIARLRACHVDGAPVRVGVLEVEHGQNRFCWAVPAHGDPIPPTSYQTAQRCNGRQAAICGAVGLAAWLVFFGLAWFPAPDASLGDFPELAIFILGMFLLVWLGFALPLLWLDTRWRMGRPTGRQRITERVYALLGLGSPFAPTQRIEEV